MLFDQKFYSVLLVPIANGGEGHHTHIRRALQLIYYIGVRTAQPLKSLRIIAPIPLHSASTLWGLAFHYNIRDFFWDFLDFSSNPSVFRKEKEKKH